MSSDLKPIKLWGKRGPNPPKVAIILSELGLPYEIVDIEFADLKKPEYLAVNPNGRAPAIQDPNNNGFILWESGAIIEYLVEKYDTQDYKISFPTGSDKAYLTKQWLYFQTTGQGPYYGQLIWFKRFHAEKIPSAVERYAKEVNRVTGVVEKHLAAQRKEYGIEGDSEGPWLVGNKMTFADLSWYMWQYFAGTACEPDEYKVSSTPRCDTDL